MTRIRIEQWMAIKDALDAYREDLRAAARHPMADVRTEQARLDAAYEALDAAAPIPNEWYPMIPTGIEYAAERRGAV